jgi:hypothetical protein
MNRLINFVLCGVIVSACAVSAYACCAQGSDIRTLGITQERSNQQIALALDKLAENQISPQEAKTVVDTAIKANQVAVTATLTKMQEDVLAWWQVALTAIASAIPVVGAGMALLNQRRNATSESRLAASIEKILAERGLPSSKT